MTPEIILGIVVIINGAQYFYTRKLGEKIEKLSNGCFSRHMKLERELGENGMTAAALHRRVDRIEQESTSH